MEHIVQFAIGIDDEGIKKRVEDYATTEIFNRIEHDVKLSMFTKNYYGQPSTTLQNWVSAKIETIVMSYKEDIIQMAAKELAEKMYRSKRAKEVLNETLEGVNHE